jgi:hypothetical protein
MYGGCGCKGPFNVNLSLNGNELHTLAILVQRKNRDRRLGAPQDQADSIEGQKKILSLLDIEL